MSAAAALLALMPGCVTVEEGAATRAEESAAAGEPADAVAKVLAGIDPRGARMPGEFAASRQWRDHVSRMRVLWDKHRDYRGDEMEDWARDEILDLQRCDFVFYPFGGPDFLFADTLFPDAKRYVLVGLEEIAPVPSFSEMTGAELGRALDGIGGSLNDFLIFSYFQTKNMRTDFARTRLRGVLPVLYTFLALSGHSIERVEQAGLRAEPGEGVRIVFRSARGGRKELYYFRENLADTNLSADGKLFEFLRTQGRPVTFVKSGSYLMHQAGFSSIRRYILEDSVAVVQDPTGVPFRHFTGGDWRLNLYGNYTRPLSIFSGHREEELAAAYRERIYPVKRLKFGMGYGLNRSETALIVARRGDH